MTPVEFVKEFQRRAKRAGLYTSSIDGVPGKGSMSALDAVLPNQIMLRGDDIPDAGDKKLKGVHDDLVAVIKEASLRSEIKFTVTEGLRTKERQAQLVKQGASKTQNSRHLTGHAVDIWPLDENGKAVPSDAAFKAGSNEARAASARLWSDLRKITNVVKAVASEMGTPVDCGVDWGWDAPHIELKRSAYP